MDPEGSKPGVASTSYAFTETSVPADNLQNDTVPPTSSSPSPPRSPCKKLDPQLLENHFTDLNRIVETNIKDMAQRLHAMVNEIVATFEKHHRETIQANLMKSRELMKDIQQMEADQDLMKYQVEGYTQRVRQALQQVFNNNEKKSIV